MVAGRPLQKDGLAGRKVANANADAGEERSSFVGFEAREKPALAEKPAGVLDQTAIGFNFQLHVPPAMVRPGAAAARGRAELTSNIRALSYEIESARANVPPMFAVIPGPPTGSGLWPARWEATAELGNEKPRGTAAWIPGSRKQKRAPE